MSTPSRRAASRSILSDTRAVPPSEGASMSVISGTSRSALLMRGIQVRSSSRSLAMNDRS